MSGEVVQLPTAAKRIVKQPIGKIGRAVRLAFREQYPWPGEFKFPADRERERQWEEDHALRKQIEDGAPADLLAAALFAALSDEQRSTVRKSLAWGAGVGYPAFKAALDTLDTYHDMLERDAAAVDRLKHIPQSAGGWSDPVDAR